MTTEQTDMFDEGKGWVHGGKEPSLGFSDTGTSKEAAESLDNGDAERVRQKVFLYIHSKGFLGSTDDAGCEQLRCSHNSYAPRRTELAKEGLVIKSGRRELTRSGRSANIWVAASWKGERGSEHWISDHVREA